MINFKKLTKIDLPLLLSWFNESHVKKWWPVPNKDELFENFLTRIRSKDTFGYVVSLDSKPIGYIQYYYVDFNTEKTGSWLPRLPGFIMGSSSSVVGTDQFIGDLNLIGRGLGTRFINEFIKYISQIEPKITIVIVDPDPLNFTAIRCYEKVGFKKVGEYDAPWGKALLMRYDI